MAEVLGVFSSGTTVVTRAIDVSRTIRTIDELWTNVHNAEHKVMAVLDELELISATLRE